MTTTNLDLTYMRRAIQLAKRGFPAPNPHVGAVIVKDGQIIGEGYHAYAGDNHAEVNAIHQAGELTKDSVIYVTLEPCCHQGRTPPCSTAIIKAGIKKVVCATLDPNPLVAGKGLAILKQHGIELQQGVMEQSALDINPIYMRFHKTHKPYVTIKAAMTLDGKIASNSGISKWITGDKARQYAHQLRAEHGAVLAGIQTVLADDPELTARLPKVKNQPIRIILSRNTELKADLKVTDTSLARTILVSPNSPKLKTIEHLSMPIEDDKINLNSLLIELGKMGITGILVEGGGETIAQFIEQGCFDGIAFFYAPKLLGGRNAITAFEGNGFASPDLSEKITDIKIKRLGDDWLVTGIRAKNLL